MLTNEVSEMTETDASKPRLATSREPGSEVVKRFEKAPVTRVEQVQYALLCARNARNWLKKSGAVNSARYMARAIKSIEGAERHALRLEKEAED
jgi:hypothetical protein